MTLLRTCLAEVQLAVMLLTRLPAGRMAQAPAIGAAVWAFPLAGALVGGIAAAVLAGALAVGVAPPLAAGLALAASVLATGGLHEDGLADCADGFGGGRDRARKLEIMRDSRIGSYGGLALILSLGLRWQALAILAAHNPKLAACALIALAISSRAGLSFALLWMPAARSDGMGKSAAGTTLGHALVGLALVIIGLAALVGPQATVLVLTTQIVVQLIFARLALRQIGGQSGDVLGAMQQLAEVAGWLVLAH
ncbi:adenosylcobinamide-GDP ribazoletransferase [Cypionkella sp. TWP1-2-1b2]|uniref:adenosylcobinamide-GDP ribazoletransferase n=1 Tax=Cypionkella sp. TWP1-2-1b2 TaxID=2804675 RepID=UPI003CE72DBC